MSLAEQLRNRRTALGMSGAALAQRARISRAYLHQLEHDAKTSPGIAVMDRLADALGTTVNDLMERPARPDAPFVSVPGTLLQLGFDVGMSRAELEMFAALSWRGSAPQSYQDWAFVWQAVVRACAMRVPDWGHVEWVRDGVLAGEVPA